MSKKREHIDDIFREELGGYTETPPPAVWEALEKRLDSPAGVASRFIGRNLWQYLVPALFILLSSGIAVSYYHENHSNTGNGTAIDQAVNNNSNNNNTSESPVNTENHKNAATVHHADNQFAKAYSPDQGYSAATINAQSAQQAGNDADAANTGQNNSNTRSSENKQTPSSDHTKSYHRRPHHRSSALHEFANAVHSNPNSYAQSNSGVGGARTPSTGNVNASPLNLSDASVVSEQPLLAADQATQNQPKTLGKADSVTTELPHTLAKKADKPAPVPVAPKPMLSSRIEIGLKGGYQFGANRDAAHELTGAAYVQYNFSDNIGLMVQPTVLFADLQTKMVNGSQSFYSIVAGTGVTTPGAVTQAYISQPDGGATDTFLTRHYNYTQKYDSIVKRYAVQQSYTEFELPVLLHLKISKKVSAYGGINIQYNKNLGINEKTLTYNKTKNGTDTTYALIDAAAPAVPALTSVLSYSGNNISAYKGPLYNVATSYSFRLGYMLGVSYQFKPRWMVDGLLQQTPVPANNVGGYNINNPLSSAYVRFSIGYTLLK